MANKTKLLFIILGLALVLLIISTAFLGRKSQGPSAPIASVPTFSNNPTFVSSVPPSIPPSLKQAQLDQEKYAQDRQQTLQNKPWILKLPLRTDDFFIYYDDSKDQVGVDLFYTPGSGEQSQIDKDKSEALNSLGSLGIDPSKQTVVYLNMPKQR